MKHFRFPFPKVRVSDVIYNAANQSFEATVTLYENNTAVKHACTVPAPITMSFEDATRRLIAQARRQQKTQSGLRARMAPLHPVLRPEPDLNPVRIFRRWSHSGFLRRRIA
jgi:hypothetical protein